MCISLRTGALDFTTPSPPPCTIRVCTPPSASVGAIPRVFGTKKKHFCCCFFFLQCLMKKRSPSSVNAFEALFQVAAGKVGDLFLLFLQLLLMLFGKGISVFAASGDSGSSDGLSTNMVDFPASAPHALGCGGTRLYCPSRLYSGAGTTESAWSSG
jgi:hypothetical protein